MAINDRVSPHVVANQAEMQMRRGLEAPQAPSPETAEELEALIEAFETRIAALRAKLAALNDAAGKDS